VVVVFILVVICLGGAYETCNGERENDAVVVVFVLVVTCLGGTCEKCNGEENIAVVVLCSSYCSDLSWRSI
jgi:hypothetical protein